MPDAEVQQQHVSNWGTRALEKMRIEKSERKNVFFRDGEQINRKQHFHDFYAEPMRSQFGQNVRWVRTVFMFVRSTRKQHFFLRNRGQNNSLCFASGLPAQKKIIRVVWFNPGRSKTIC